MHPFLDFNASVLAAFVVGLFSSLHCIGMCGSIIGTLTLSLSPTLRQNKRRLLLVVFSYNMGRISSYTLAGAIVGAISALLTAPFADGHGYRVLQVLSALVITGAGLYIGGWFPRFAYIEKLGARLWKLIEPFGRRLIPVKTIPQALLFGMIWGWLPCGLIYTALAMAVTSGSVWHSTTTMLAFGLGTLPAVMGVGIMTHWLTKLARIQQFKRVAGVLLIVFGLLAAFPDINPMRVDHIMRF
ncbi:MAG: sulfite exporter TauE/SafE family protein [Methylomonas sp.]|nr:sulfite exporter TauE/SafE family protein [Methylomonas sp.]PPD21045.1 MAG: hypothetical protein CTY23_06770 [Methylomonas sp.]PPD27072.1 MAG: hypothetical protein CTY22_03155 [Methylomonas sp.]PPD39018.1 MAG: hypothetical protein CTY21_03150 [Methylomonas sp.]PPD40875.1 MAG: hypothetical protein CTY17_05120 [Methylomonas sp.]